MLPLSRLRGFTLIELLVVIAIIGILASVVLASLNSARDKGADAAIKSSLNSARSQAELYYDDNGRNYDGVCANAGGILPMFSAADTTNGASGANCIDNATAWAANAQLVASTTAWYCVDSRGSAQTTGDTIDEGANDFEC